MHSRNDSYEIIHDVTKQMSKPQKKKCKDMSWSIPKCAKWNIQSPHLNHYLRKEKYKNRVPKDLPGKKILVVFL